MLTVDVLHRGAVVQVEIGPRRASQSLSSRPEERRVLGVLLGNLSRITAASESETREAVQFWKRTVMKA